MIIKPEQKGYDIVARIYVEGRKTSAYVTKDGWDQLDLAQQESLNIASNKLDNEPF